MQDFCSNLQCLGFNESCGGVVTESLIDFPGNGSRHSSYSNYMNCKWIISRNYSYMLKFHKFDLEDSEGCRYDYLQLGAGGSKKCGNRIPDDVFVPRTIDLIFHSDHNVAGGGFKIQIIKDERGMLLLNHSDFIFVVC